MKVLVTGGAGFIGSHVVEELIVKGYEVRVLDNLSTGRLENLKHVEETVEVVIGDVRDYGKVLEAVNGADAVIHEAALASVTRSIEDPLTVNQVNVEGTLNLLKACVELGVKKLIYASSSSIYGDTPTLPKREDMKPNPLSPYAVSKYAGEEFCRVFHKVYGLEAVALRYFNVYGPRQQYGPYSGVITIFINRLLNGQPPIIFGDGEQTRDFTYVKDVAEATVKALEAKQVGGEAINIASSSPISINNLASLLIELMGFKEVKPLYTEPRKGDVKYSYADIHKAEALLGWKPRTSLTEGLIKTIDWFREQSMKT